MYRQEIIKLFISALIDMMKNKAEDLIGDVMQKGWRVIIFTDRGSTFVECQRQMSH
jgi:hypothetical protein